MAASVSVAIAPRTIVRCPRPPRSHSPHWPAIARQGVPPPTQPPTLQSAA